MKITRPPVYNRVKRTLAIDEEFPISGNGNGAALLSATGAMEIAFGDGPFVEFESGTSMSFDETEEFTATRIKNISGAENSIDLYIGRGDFFDMRFQSTGTITVIEARPDVFLTYAKVPVGSGANTVILTQNVKRKEAFICNDGADKVYVQHNAGGAGFGIPLAAGATAIIETTAAIQVYNPSGAAIDIYPSFTEFGA